MSDRAPAFDSIYPELMMAEGEIDLTKTSCNVVGCGMGFTEKARKRLADAIAAPVPLIVDADALRMIAEDNNLQAAAIIHSTPQKVQADRIGAARELAVQTGAISILKGAGTVVALRSSRTWINPTGSAMLATAGSGDVLSGMLGAFFAQGYDMVCATLAAVYLHGRAGEDYAAGFTASDIAPAAAQTLNTMRLSAAEDGE